MASPSCQGCRQGADPLPVQGCLPEGAEAWGGGADLVYTPAPWGAGWSQAPPLTGSPPLTHCSVPQFPHWQAWAGWRSGTCHRAREPVGPTAQAVFWGGPWGGPCCAEPLSCPTATAPCAMLVLCPGDSTCGAHLWQCTLTWAPMVPPGTSLGKQISHHVPVQQGCP